MSKKYKIAAILLLIFNIMFYVSGCKAIEPVNSKGPDISAKTPDSPTKQQDPAPPEDNTNKPDPATPPVKLVEYTGPIYHLFTHALIAFPDIAYSRAGGNGSLDTDCITPLEYKRTLEELYKNNFVLIDIRSTYEVVTENGQQVVKDKKLMLPEGKKPVIMSVDDIVYDPVKMGYGMVDKIILDRSGNFATYTKHKDGKEVISYDNEVIPILDQFVKQHPDFSFNGAKATLCVTGWVGILGYRIDRLAPNRQSEIDAVKPIVQRLKDTGWTFASHSYGHRHENQISYALFVDDTAKWHNEIEPIVGPTDIYVYPYGEKVATTDPKYKLLLQYGFKMICGVGMDPYWKNYGSSIFMNRQAVDGYSLRYYHKYLSPLLDTIKVFDGDERKLH